MDLSPPPVADRVDDGGRLRRALILVSLVVVAGVIQPLGAWPADRHAETVERDLRAGIAQVGFERMAAPTPFDEGSALAELTSRTGLQIWARWGPEGAEYVAEAIQWWTFWQGRCVIARVNKTSAETRVVDTSSCFDADWPDEPPS